jgi:hypothetical protein
MAEVKASIEVLGLKELDAAFRALAAEVRGPILQAALAEAGEIVRQDAADRIHSRSGRTAADLRVEVQMMESLDAGVAAIGGSPRGPASRSYILHFLEFGTKKHEMPKKRKSPRTYKRKRVFMASPSTVYGSHVNHLGMAPQAPLTNALLARASECIKALAAGLWRGIERVCAEQPKAA